MQNIAKLVLFFLFFGVQTAVGQTITLRNPSFEDIAQHSTTPSGWYDCGQAEESPPDVQPGFFEVLKPAADKKTYLGLVTRDNDTWEGVGQRLSVPMQAGKCYSFSLSLCRSEKYISISKTTRVEENFSKPIRVRVWGGTSYCSKKQKLAETGAISHTAWKSYSFKLKPTQNYSYIFLEAFYEPTILPYNGNVLIDNCSNLEEIPCNKEIKEPIAEEKPTKPEPKPKPKPEKPSSEVAPPTPKPKEEPIAVKPKKKVITPELDRTKIEKGTVIQVNNLYFKADSFRVEANSYAALNEVYDFLLENPDVSIEVGGHTNGTPSHSYCDKLSESRAKAVVDYLIDKGIAASRLSYKGYGKRQPIATNETVEGRRKNQRVEIKILSFKG
jgi:outer membrane protein OmpA-like peptidoglycan-associated protein